MSYLRDCWQVAAFGVEIVPGEIFKRRLLDEALVFYRIGDGRVVALEDRCAHRSAPLSRGTLLGDTIRCGYHGFEYGPDGRCQRIPGQQFVPPTARVRSFPVIERQRMIWIWMGDEQLADASLVPDVPWMKDLQWITADGYHRVLANYKLLNDNLLDLSHETYVHTRTIGADIVAESPIKVTEEAGAVQVEKHMERCNPPPFYQYLARLPASAVVRRWQRTVYKPPGYIVIDVGVESIEPILGSNRVDGRVINLVTPETAVTSHYFWAFARNFRLDEPAVTTFIRENVGRTFDEDKEMLELQQSNLGAEERDPLYRIAVLADAGAIRGRRLLETLIKAQHATLEVK